MGVTRCRISAIVVAPADRSVANDSGWPGQVRPVGGAVRSRKYDSTASLMHALPPPKIEP